MPEQLTRHPDVTLKVLQSAGAQCGVGAPQQILKQCPRERFCKLPGGEICVYGLDGAASMTQITASDWQQVCAKPASQRALSEWSGEAGWTAFGLIGGVVLAAAVGRMRRGRR